MKPILFGMLPAALSLPVRILLSLKKVAEDQIFNIDNVLNF